MKRDLSPAPAPRVSSSLGGGANGTLFLDEVGELPVSFQAKLLRVIQEKEIVRVGGISPIKVDVRIIAATNRDLGEMIRQRLFREDLYYRLNVFPLTVLPLRKRKGDIIPLATYFVRRYNQEFGMEKILSVQGMNFLSNQPSGATSGSCRT
jgi:transcriptional regulator with GAF, ATPase, and Fis domain